VGTLAVKKEDYKKGLDIAHKRWEVEIELLWKRTVIFWGITLAGLTAYTYSFDKSAFYALLIANFGFISSFFWALANRGSKFWQDSWDAHIEELEPKVLGYELSQKPITVDKGFWGGKRFSPSRLLVALSDYVTLVWFSILMYQLSLIVGFTNVPFVPLFAFVVTGFTLCYAFYVFRDTQNHRENRKKTSATRH
jgi:hypothetical protein